MVGHCLSSSWLVAARSLIKSRRPCSDERVKNACAELERINFFATEAENGDAAFWQVMQLQSSMLRVEEPFRENGENNYIRDHESQIGRLTLRTRFSWDEGAEEQVFIQLFEKGTSLCSSDLEAQEIESIRELQKPLQDEYVRLRSYTGPHVRMILSLLSDYSRYQAAPETDEDNAADGESEENN